MVVVASAIYAVATIMDLGLTRSIVATAATATGLVPSFAHPQRTTTELLLVELGDGRPRLMLISHVDEAKPLGLTRLTIVDEDDVANPPRNREQPRQIILGCSVREISYIQTIVRHTLTLGFVADGSAV